MPANNTLVLVIQAETGQANSSIQGTNKILAAFETQAMQSALRAGKGFEGFERSAIRAAVNVQNKFSVLGGVLGANVVSALTSRAGELSLAGLKIAASFERSRIGLEAFLGSGEKANALFDEIQAFALKSPFEFKDLLIGANRLLAFDFAAKDVPKTLQAVSSAVGALGGDIGKVNDLITALGQIQQAGKLTGEELRQLRNAGVEGIVVQGLGEAYGKTAAEIQKAVRDGIIPGKDAVMIATRALERRFGEFNERVSKTTEVTFSNVKDSFGKASEQAFKPFLADINELVKGTGPQMEQFGKFIMNNANTLKSLAEGALVLGGALVAAKIALGIEAITIAIRGMTLATALNPWAALAAGVTLAGYAVYKGIKANEDYAKSIEEKFVKNLQSQGKSIDEIVAAMQRYNSEVDNTTKVVAAAGGSILPPKFEASAQRVKDILEGTKANGLERQIADVKKEMKLFSDQEMEELKKRMAAQQAAAGSDEQRKRLKDAEIQAFKILEDAQKKEASNLGKIRFELAENLRQYGLTKQAIEDIGRASTVAFEAELARVSNTTFEKQQEAERKRMSDLQKARLDAEAESLQSGFELRRDTLDRVSEFEIRALEFVRDKRMADLEMIDTRTVDSKIGVEQQKSEIEADYLTKRAILQSETVDRLAQREIEKERVKLNSKLISEVAFELKRDAIMRDATQKGVEIMAEQEAAVAILRQKSASESAKIQRDYFEDVFQDAKQSVGSLWDQFTRQGQTAAEKMQNVLKLAFEALSKELVTTALARQLTPLFAALRGGSSGSPGNILGSLGGLGGGFGGIGSISRPGAPGGTGGFAGPVSGFGGAGSFGGLGGLGLFGAGKGLLASLGAIGTKSAVAGLPLGVSVIGANGQVITLGAAKSAGVSGAAGGAMLAGGGILAFDGLRRGGLTGLLETTAGGALIGAKFGGPIGALIGGAVGAAAGFARLFIKGAADKAREKIKAVYGVDISSKDILQQFVAIAKQSYGGNLDVAVRSQEVRDIVELYAMSTGQSATGLKPQMQPLSISQRGGVLSILSNYGNGRPVSPVTGSPAPAAPMVVQLQLDAATTEMVLEGRAVSAMANNPRAVQGAVVNAQRANVGRQQSAVNMFAPGLILS